MKDIFRVVTNDTDRKKILEAIYNLSIPPHLGRTSEDIRALLVGDIINITEFLIEYYDLATNLIKSSIQSFIFGVERLSLHEKVDNFNLLKKKIEEDPAYTRFRIFYGYDFEFYPDLDHDKARKYKEQKIGEFVKQINEENLKDWVRFLKDLMRGYEPAERGRYTYLGVFLEKIGYQKSEIAFKLLDIKELSPFINPILVGLLSSSDHEKAEKILKNYSKDEDKQLAITESLFFRGVFDDNLFSELYPNLIKSDDTKVLCTLLQTIIRYYKKHKNHKEKISNIINKFTELGFFDWSSKVRYLSDDYLTGISDENMKSIMNNLKYCKHIGYNEEHLLNPMCEKRPKDIIDFFHERVELANITKTYDPIPFNFQIIDKTLAKNWKKVIPEVIKWFSKDDYLKNWHASHLFKNIFPEFSSEIEDYLINLIKKKQKDKLMIVLHILEKYEGKVFLHNAIKEIIKLYSLDKKLISSLYRILSNIGLVSGQYGISEAYKKRKEETMNWLTDTNAKIKSFAKGYHNYLDKMINIEEDRVDKEILFMEKKFEMNSKSR